MYRQRLMKEAAEAGKKKFSHYLLVFNQADLFAWEAFIEGPEGTPYEANIFHVKLLLSSEYPIAPPKIFFKTKIFHPNVHFATGEVCLDIIKSEWSPTWTLEALCKALRLLMENPNEDSPLNCDAANLIRLKEKDAYFALGRMYAR
jgi:peroxin-4